MYAIDKMNVRIKIVLRATLIVKPILTPSHEILTSLISEDSKYAGTMASMSDIKAYLLTRPSLLSKG